MELELYLLGGLRKGTVITIPDVNQTPQGTMPWILEDEPIEFRLKAPRKYKKAVLEVYQHSLEFTMSEYPDAGDSTYFIWTPRVGRYKSEKLFLNYFGVSEITILLFDDQDDIAELVSFQPMQVAARQSSAQQVEDMFEYLAGISGEALHSVFSATRHSVGFDEGTASPSYTLERIEHSINLLRDTLPLIFNKPITRLVPEQKLITATGSEELDDSSIGWLLENLSVLEPDENPDQAHIYYEGQHFRASKIRIPVLKNNSDVYENRVVHGFIELLIRESQQIAQRYSYEFKDKNKRNLLPKGYISFFEKISRFKSQLVGTQMNHVERYIDSLKQIKALIDYRLPVSRSVTDRPIITPKTIDNTAYRDVFTEVIKWHERGAVDWTAYENLFAIENIPTLFESYAYFRVVTSVNRYFNPLIAASDKPPVLNLEFVDTQGVQISIEREPNYWTPQHSSKHKQRIINSEGHTVSDKERYRFNIRGQSGPNSRRQPDIAIQIKEPNDDIRLLVLDAKHTFAEKAFTHYLPELTMKYVHGVHRAQQRSSTVTSLTILYPCDESSNFTSFHHSDSALFGKYHVEPNLQTVGLILGSERDSDCLVRLIERLLEINNIQKPIKDKVSVG